MLVNTDFLRILKRKTDSISVSIRKSNVCSKNYTKTPNIPPPPPKGEIDVFCPFGGGAGGGQLNKTVQFPIHTTTR